MQGAISDLGEDFGHEFYEAELKYPVDHEWVRRADDALWRRTKTRHVAECGTTISCESVAGGVYAAEVVAGVVRMMPGCEVQPGYLDSLDYSL